MNSWLSSWVKKQYADVKGDLFSCFMVRNSGMGTDHAQMGFMTPYVWMFIGTYEKLRKQLLSLITSLILWVPKAGGPFPSDNFTCRRVFSIYIIKVVTSVEDFDRPQWQEPRALEALANPNCGWFYRADADGFESIPGSPIAYWASSGILNSFKTLPQMRGVASPRQGLATGDNERFIRCWWEVARRTIGIGYLSRKEAQNSGLKWFPCNKGGGYRKWYGNNELVVNWGNDGFEIRALVKNGRQASRPQNMDWYFKEGILGTISSSDLSMRYSPRRVHVLRTKAQCALHHCELIDVLPRICE